MDALEVDSEQFAAVSVAAVGQATAEAVVEAGLRPALVPESATADALAATLRQVMRPGARIFYPRSAMGRDVLQNELRDAGFDVLAIDVYRTLPEPNVDSRVLDQVRRGEVDVLTFASPSSVRNLIDLLGQECVALSTIPTVCAGPITGQAAREAGLLVSAVSDRPDAAAMSAAVAAWWLRSGGGALREEPALTTHAGRSAR
jgi:uroporphyrinogen III methyltransferase/synthase